MSFDREKTQLQETGEVNVSRLTLLDAVQITAGVGLALDDVRLMPMAMGVLLQVRTPR
jgi:hypothetical protein